VPDRAAITSHIIRVASFSALAGDSMTIGAPPAVETKSQLRKTMGFWDVLLFNIATVLGPRWIARRAQRHVIDQSVGDCRRVLFCPGALVINELSSRFPEEGGLYVSVARSVRTVSRVHRWMTYWIYTVFYFPGCCWPVRR